MAPESGSSRRARGWLPAGVVMLSLALPLAACVTTTFEPEPIATSVATPAPTAEPTSTPGVAAGFRDGGAIVGATGTPEADQDGQIIGYIVAEGDNPHAIIARFGLESLGQLENDDGLRIGDNITIFSGERLRLIAN